MLNKYLLIAIAVLFGGCILFYNLWDNTKMELNNVKAQKVTLEQELKRRNENEKNLSKRITDLEKAYSANATWANSLVDANVLNVLQKQCKACK